jgi:hypothetical protein
MYFVQFMCKSHFIQVVYGTGSLQIYVYKCINYFIVAIVLHRQDAFTLFSDSLLFLLYIDQCLQEL